MRPLHQDRAVTLTAGLARQALTAASGIFGLAAQAGGPALRPLEETAMEAAASGRPLDEARRDVSAAIARTGHTEPARRSQ